MRVYWRVDGTTSVDILTDLSRRRVSTLVDRWSDSERYDSARPCRHENARTHNRYWILSGTWSHWSSWEMKLCVLISSQRTQVEERCLARTEAAASAIQTHQLTPSNRYWQVSWLTWNSVVLCRLHACDRICPKLGSNWLAQGHCQSAECLH